MERRYGAWAGNPKGRQENPDNCIASIYANSRDMISCQCSKKRGKGPDGLYCGTHAAMLAKGSHVFVPSMKEAV
jgi:hypothetical protein